MKTIPVLSLAAVGSILVACASDPNKELQTARTDQKEHFHDNVQSQVQISDEHAKERKEGQAKTMNDLVKDNATVEEKKNDVAKDRAAFGSESRDRLAKIDARASDLRTKDKVATPAARISTKPMWLSFDKDRKETQVRYDGLSAKSNDEVSSAKQDLVTRMDALEKTLDGIASKVTP